MEKFDGDLKRAKWRRTYNVMYPYRKNELWKEHPEWGENRILREAKKLAEEDANRAAAEPGVCYIATFVYGSYDNPEVWVLRQYRDEVLLQTWLGRFFVKVYYAISPSMVRILGEKKWFHQFWRTVLDRVVQRLSR